MTQHPVRAAREADIARIWAEATPADAYGARQLGGRLLIPAMRNGVMRNLFALNDDGAGEFLTTAKTQGCCFLIGDARLGVFVTLQYYEAIAVHLSTGLAAAVAFNESNLPHVARKLWIDFHGASIHVVADRRNVHAQRAAALVGVDIVPPEIARGAR